MAKIYKRVPVRRRDPLINYGSYLVITGFTKFAIVKGYDSIGITYNAVQACFSPIEKHLYYRIAFYLFNYLLYLCGHFIK